MPDDERGPCRETDPVFVFYGRVGREDASSAGWQRRAVEEWLKGQRWHIAATYVDTVPRTTLWAERPQAKALLMYCARRHPATTVVVASDATQAFGTSGLWSVILLLTRHGAQLRVPGFDAPADLTSDHHRHVAEILSGVAPPASARPRLGMPQHRWGYSRHQGCSRWQRRRAAR